MISSSSVQWQGPRRGLRDLATLDIEARPVWKPMHLQPVFEDCRFIGSGHCERLFENGLCLPSGSSLSPADLEIVLGVLEKHLIP